MRKVLLLGASGNIGGQVLDVLSADPKAFTLVGFSVGVHGEKIPGILERFPSVKALAALSEEDALALRASYPALAVYGGSEGLISLIAETDAELVVNALVGFAGLGPSLAALRQKRILCLANKETLVVGGELVKRLLAQGLGPLYPIDSEHVALAQCLAAAGRENVDRLILTASGGAFRNRRRAELADVTPEEALQHPTWKMGQRITIDSATMMNKGFEMIEAHYLFDWPLDKIGILLHDEAEVHSLAQLKDGSYWAEVDPPDMHGPIAYALYEGRMGPHLRHEKNLEGFGPYHYHAFAAQRYPAVGLALAAFGEGGTALATLNAADEEAVALFLKGQLPFLAIEKVVSEALRRFPTTAKPTLRDILKADALTRLYVRRKWGASPQA